MSTHIRETIDAQGDLVDAHYFCSAGCWQDSFMPERMGPAASDNSRDSALRAGLTIGGEAPCSVPYVEGVEGHYTYCAECGVRLNGTDDAPSPVVVNLLSRPPILDLTSEAAPEHDLAEYTAQAREMGREAARNAATWTVDGNMSQEHIRAVLRMIEDGDPAFEQYLPVYPNLSGEWAGDPTPASLAAEITGEHKRTGTNDDVSLVDALADAWEEGVSETFQSACEAELHRWLA